MLGVSFIYGFGLIIAFMGIIPIDMGRRRFYACLEDRTKGEWRSPAPSVLLLTLGGIMLTPLTAWPFGALIYVLNMLKLSELAVWLVMAALAYWVCYGVYRLISCVRRASLGGEVSAKDRKTAASLYVSGLAIFVGYIMSCFLIDFN